MTPLLPIRLPPGSDLRRALQEAAAKHGASSAFVVAGIGSLSEASLRYAGDADESQLAGPLEILSLSGTLSACGAHLHMAVSDAAGRVYGGHVGHGNTVRTTAEVLLATLQDWTLAREHDPATGYDELVVRQRARAPIKQSLALVSLVVRDYDEALAFFVGTLGFTLIEDTFIESQAKRWVVVAPPGSCGAQLLLARAGNAAQEARIGDQTGGRVSFFLYTDDFDRDHRAYLAKGVRFVREPRVEPYGKVAVFADLYGNLWDLLEPASPGSF